MHYHKLSIILIMCFCLSACVTSASESIRKEPALVVCFLASCRAVFNDRTQGTETIRQDGEEKMDPVLDKLKAKRK